MFLEESQNTLVFVRPTFRTNEAVIFRRIKHHFKILRFAKSDQFFYKLHRILNVNIIIRFTVQDQQRPHQIIGICESRVVVRCS